MMKIEGPIKTPSLEMLDRLAKALTGTAGNLLE
jgi:hypothetical protein